MNLCSQITVTWYPGVPPSSASPVVLLSPSHYVTDPAPLRVAVEQLVQRADYVRSEAPDFIPRNNVATTLEWTEVRKIVNPVTAAQTALDVAVAMPTQQGWVRVQLEGLADSWQVTATVRGVASDHDARKGDLFLTYTLDCGVISRYTGVAPTPTPVTDTFLLEGSSPGNLFALLLESIDDTAMDSQKTSSLAAIGTVLDNMYVPAVDPNEALDDDKNKRLTAAVLLAYVQAKQEARYGQPFTGEIASGQKSVVIDFDVAFGAAPEFFVVNGVQPADETNVEIYVDGDSATTTQITIRAKSATHTGIKVMGFAR